MAAQEKIPLPKFLTLLTSNSTLSVPKAMAISGKIFKSYNTKAKLAELDEVKLVSAGVDDKEDRKLVMAAVRKAGYASKTPPTKARISGPKKTFEEDSVAGPSAPMTTVATITTPTKRKRKERHNSNEFLPDKPKDEAAKYGSLEFNEVLDEEALKTKFTVINRAPVMTAWATVVAERLGFQREEALSIATVYTEMNAISKGVSIGVYNKGKDKDLDAARGGSQPYVDIIGRRPLYQTQNNQWRALSSGTPVQPSTAFSYISRSFRQTTPHILGALRLLANSFTPQEINQKAWSLYAEFRPEADGWGQRSEVRCDAILALRKPASSGVSDTAAKSEAVDAIVKFEDADKMGVDEEDASPERKKPRGMTLEEYEAALDEDTTFDDVNLDLYNHL